MSPPLGLPLRDTTPSFWLLVADDIRYDPFANLGAGSGLSGSHGSLNVLCGRCAVFDAEP